MENPLWADIQLQGQNLAHVIGRIFGEERANIDAAARFMRPDRPTVLIGVASAQYLCMPAEQYLNALGFPASTLCASDALYSHLPALRHSNVVINSRSGETAEVVKLGQALAEAGIPFVAITNEKDSSLARLAEQVVWVDTHKDDLVSINVVTGMMTATLALCAAQAGTLDALRPELERLPDGMVRCVAQAGEAAQTLAALFTGVRPIYLLYRGPSRGAAYCGRLALEEIARTPSIAMGAAEFRQGPNEVIDERFGAVVFCGKGKPGELNLSLAGDIQRFGGRTLLVGEVPTTPAGGLSLSFPIEGISDTLRPVLEVVPVQMLAYRLAQAQGYPPGETRYITKIILSEEGIPNGR